MRAPINDGGPAFPADSYSTGDGGRKPVIYSGMSLRDYFATNASEEDLRQQGELIRANLVRVGKAAVLPDGWRVKARYMHADAMLAERSRRRS